MRPNAKAQFLLWEFKAFYKTASKYIFPTLPSTSPQLRKALSSRDTIKSLSYYINSMVPRKQKCLCTKFRQTVRAVSWCTIAHCQILTRRRCPSWYRASWLTFSKPSDWKQGYHNHPAPLVPVVVRMDIILGCVWTTAQEKIQTSFTTNNITVHFIQTQNKRLNSLSKESLEYSVP